MKAKINKKITVISLILILLIIVSLIVLSNEKIINVALNRCLGGRI